MASELEVGKLGAGIAPTATLHVNSEINGVDAIVDNPTHNTQFLIKASAANKNSEILFGDSAADDVGKIDYDHNDNSLKLNTNSATALTISSTGAVDISGPASHATALTVGNSTGGTELQVIPKENESITLNSAEGATAHALILATGGTPRLTVASTGLATFSGGIAFSQTNSSATGATATGTTLDHYEEGTFTPTAWDNDTTQITTSIAVGRYVRIGRMCHVSLRLKRNDTMTGTSNIYFRGLPFSSQNEGTTNDTKNIGIGGCWLPSDTEHGMAYALPGTANFIFIDAKAADGGYLTSADWGNTYNWYAAFTYEVA